MQIPVSGRLFHLLTAGGLSEFSDIFSSRRKKFPGDHIPGVPPVPIPNTAVKPRVANGSRTLGPARVGRCQVYGPVGRKTNRASFLPVQICPAALETRCALPTPPQLRLQRRHPDSGGTCATASGPLRTRRPHSRVLCRRRSHSQLPAARHNLVRNQTRP